MTQTSRYALPLIQAGQAQKEVTHNTALATIDTLIQLAVASRHAPAAAATVGTSAIVPSGARDAWVGHDGQIATLTDAGWDFIVPADGCVVYVVDENVFIHFAGGEWRDAWAVPALTIGGLILSGPPPAVVADPAAGSVVDAEARTALAQLLAALRSIGLIATA